MTIMTPPARARAIVPDRAVLLGLALVMAAGLMLSACNTTAGAGQDVKATGNAITRGANDVKNGL